MPDGTLAPLVIGYKVAHWTLPDQVLLAARFLASQEKQPYHPR
jgi:hypothetical protein